jgi:hypothetical protein
MPAMIEDATLVQRDPPDGGRLSPGGWADELERLARRARRRWLRSTLYALLCTAAVVAVAARRPRSYVSRVVFHVAQGGPGSADWLGRDGRLRDDLANVVFSDARLRALIEQHGLYPTRMARDPRLAIAAMRDDLEVDGWRHAARLAIAYHGRSAQEAYDVATELGQLVGALGPRWQLLDAGHPEPEGVSQRTRLALLALIVVLLALPLCAVAVGACDPRVYDLDDVRRLGMPVLGAVHGFAGDNAGALVERLRHEAAATLMSDSRGSIPPS